MARRLADQKKVAARLLRQALELPDAWEDHPWGDTVVKVNKKIFTFIGTGADPEYPPSVTVKLGESHEQAMQVEGAEATGYGLGRAGWVTLKLATAPPVDVLEDWIEESYRIVALKRQVAALDART